MAMTDYIGAYFRGGQSRDLTRHALSVMFSPINSFVDPRDSHFSPLVTAFISSIMGGTNDNHDNRDLRRQHGGSIDADEAPHHSPQYSQQQQEPTEPRESKEGESFLDNLFGKNKDKKQESISAEGNSNIPKRNITDTVKKTSEAADSSVRRNINNERREDLGQGLAKGFEDVLNHITKSSSSAEAQKYIADVKNNDFDTLREQFEYVVMDTPQFLEFKKGLQTNPGNHVIDSPVGVGDLMPGLGEAVKAFSKEKVQPDNSQSFIYKAPLISKPNNPIHGPSR